MATELLAVPEQYLREVIAIFRIGTTFPGVRELSPAMTHACDMIEYWCDEEEEYLERMAEDD